MPVGGKTTRGAVRRLHQGMSDSEVYQDDHVPEGARPNRWQSLHVVCKYHDHHKPVYSLQRHLDVWHVGASAKNALHCKVMRINARIRLCLHVVLSRCEVGTAAAE